MSGCADTVSNMMMPRRGSAFVLALMLIFSGCRPGSTQQAPPDLQVEIDDPEAYEVYKNAIQALHWSAVLLRRETTLGMPMRRVNAGRVNVVCDPYLSPDHDETWRSVLDDYVRQNSRKRTLQPLFAPWASPTLISSEAISSAFRDSPYDWTRFFRELDPRGYFEVSAVGFDPTKTKAVVYSAVHCGGTCGKGMHSAWEKRGGVWVAVNVLSRTCEWRS